MADLIVFGTGKAALVASFYLDRFSDDFVVGYTVDDAYVDSDTFNGKPLVPWSELEQRFPPSQVHLLGPVTAARLNSLRRDRFHEGKQRGYSFASFVHPESQNHANVIGENCFILDSCTIQPYVRIDDNVIVWSKTIIGHHSRVEEGCFLSSLVGVGGSVHVGRESYLGGFCSTGTGIILGARSVLLNGAFVSRDGPDDSVYVGQKPREIRGGRDRVMKFF